MRAPPGEPTDEVQPFGRPERPSRVRAAEGGETTTCDDGKGESIGEGGRAWKMVAPAAAGEERRKEGAVVVAPPQPLSRGGTVGGEAATAGAALVPASRPVPPPTELVADQNHALNETIPPC